MPWRARRSIAAGANRSVGGIVRIQEQRLSQPSPIRFQMVGGAGSGRGGGSTPVEPGQIDIRAQVTLTVSIK